MTDQPNPTLPEKCCAKCGFLYALANNIENPAEAVFDPDLSRVSVGYLSSGDITTMMYQHTPNKQGTTKEAITYKLGNTNALRCLRNIDGYTINLKSYSVEISAKEIELLIHKDRQNQCKNEFIPYHPGFSAKEHAEIQLQEQRDAQQQAFQDRWNRLVFDAEENARNREERWKHLEAEHRKQNNIITIANLILAFILGGFVVAEFIIKFIIPK